MCGCDGCSCGGDGVIRGSIIRIISDGVRRSMRYQRCEGHVGM